jgi:serine/threonine protein phosphatase PrpC
VRRANEDALVILEVGEESSRVLQAEGIATIPERGLVAAVADGMGGVRGGAFASSKLQEALTNLIAKKQYDEPHPTKLHSLVNEINFDILDYAENDPGLFGMGTTMTMAWLKYGTLNLVNVGDSRLYRLKEEKFEQLSKDQSYVGKLLREGQITAAEAREHPERNVIDQAVGSHPEGVLPDISTFSYQVGDLFLICSDGLNEELTDEQMANVLVRRKSGSLMDTAKLLVESALVAGGRDNVSVVLLEILPPE